ncbi:MAG: bifunctional histidinol-phosphatase/imidazoleglycerol-phosphate dehydratase HisB [Bacteroidales bacterium]|nr:bifunctional histidinol-phosphatase/imidazoleglycerol-phosphate dehydratase HisB [Bacteroidales bacterium]
MRKKVLFIDRDGTIIVEPPDTQQVDTLEQLEFLPHVIRMLYQIRHNLDFEMVMVSNQDGLGTPSYPEDNFNQVQDKLLTILRNEDIWFDAIYIDRSRPEDNKPTRKPGTAMLGKYLAGHYDLKESYVIGDRISDIELAKNLGCKGILIGEDDMWELLEQKGLSNICSLITNDWEAIYAHIALPHRIITVHRKTHETEVMVKINLDGRGFVDVSTGLKFLDHMIAQIGRHAGIDLQVETTGDLEVDEHHTIEDTALALGEAFAKAIGNKAGMQRYGFCLPMDDCLAQVAIDFGGRPWLVWDVTFKRERIGDVPTEMFYHFFKSFSDTALCNLNIKAEGENEHHKIESIFKAFARAIRMAIHRDPFNTEIPSTKGKL